MGLQISFNTKPAVSFMSISFDREIVDEINEYIDESVIPQNIDASGNLVGQIKKSEKSSQLMGFPLMRSVYRDKDVDAFRDGRFESVLNTYRELNQFTDEGSPGRLWNDTTAMVIEGKAAMQVMGDWARGEFAVAGKEAMVDYSCVIPGKEKYVALGGDVFVFPKNDDPKVKDTQLAMASMMVNPTVQAKFNNAKGSLPMRLDVDTSAADACMQMGLDLIQNPDAIMRESDDWNTPAFTSAWDDIISEFRNDPNYTVAQVMDDLEGVLTSCL